MTTVIVSSHAVKAGAMPSELEGHITVQQFQTIRSSIVNVEHQMCCMACAIEWGVCLCFGFFCVFCAHPCIQNMLAADKIRIEMGRLNQQLFQSQYVVAYQGGNVIINTANIPRNIPQQSHVGTYVTPAAVAPGQVEMVAVPAVASSPHEPQYVQMVQQQPQIVTATVVSTPASAPPNDKYSQY